MAGAGTGCVKTPVRVIDAFVDNLDLAKLGFKIYPAITGRPGYHPSSMLKLFIYGYLNRIQSSRRLERESGRNVELMWLLGRLAHDFKTIADFRKDNGKGIRLDQMGELLSSQPESMLTRKQTVEHPYGTIKCWMG